LAQPANSADVQAFAAGFELEGELLRPADLVISADPHKVELVIHEGKYHQVKRMFAARGNAVVYLKRLVFGPQVLPEDLVVGEARPPTAEELRALYKAVGLDNPN
jgi:16S rRNA pseudouridine516 synthase